MSSRRLYCFGESSHGQLGICVPNNTTITVPVLVVGAPMRADTGIGTAVVDVACGSQHSLFRTDDGEVWSCGSNDVGQLGRSAIYPIALRGAKIIQVACGDEHSLAVVDDGRLIAWGSNQFGQLGMRLPTNETFSAIPRRVALTEVVQASCGSRHSVALLDNGRVFSWGENKNGQLGKGSRQSTNTICIDIPAPIDSLIGIPIAQVVCGGRHTVLLSASGAVFTFGDNLHGQLGHGDNADRYHPVQIKSLRSMKVITIACGDAHTNALTKEGQLWTFGCGIYGQLGHGRKESSSVPQPVVELMGSCVSRVAAGRNHTIAVVSRKIYVFGLFGSGRLRDETTPRQIAATENVSSVFAGGDHTFYMVAPGVDVRFGIHSSNVNATDMQPAPNCQLTTPNFLTLHRLQTVMAAKDNLSLVGLLESVFSSSSCINGSFLFSDQRFHASKNNIGVDVDEAMEAFNLLAASIDADRLADVVCVQLSTYSIVSIQVQSGLESGLFTELTPSPPDIEALRLYIVLPWFHGFVNPKNRYRQLHIPYAIALLALSPLPLEIVEHWWSLISSRHLNRVVRAYKLAVSCILDVAPKVYPKTSQEKLYLRPCLNLLKRLNAINIAHQKIPFESFYIDDLSEKYNIVQDYASWLINALEGELYFADYAFLFNGATKTTLIEVEASLQMQRLVQQANRQNLAALVVPFVNHVNPFLELHIDRNNIVTNTLTQLMQIRPEDLKRPLKIHFLNEEAEDVGGVTKEFFMLLFQQLFDVNYGMFVENAESHLLWFSGSPFEQPANFQLVGILCGLAIYNHVVVDIPFPLALYKKLLKQPVTLDDYKQLSPTEARSLEELLDYDDTDFVQVFELTFTISIASFGDLRTVELKPNGANIMVNLENKHEYVRLYVSYQLDTGLDGNIERQYDAFAVGFHRVLTSRILHVFQPRELMEMVVGNENYDWDVLRSNTVYRGEYWAGHETIKAFWDVFFNMTIDEKKKFMQFLMGSTRIPIQGMKVVQMHIQPSSAESMPVAHTCFNLLDLPNTADRDVLQRKLLDAIQYTQGFTLV